MGLVLPPPTPHFLLSLLQVLLFLLTQVRVPTILTTPEIGEVPHHALYGEHNLAYQEYPPKTAILSHVPSRSVCPWDYEKMSLAP